MNKTDSSLKVYHVLDLMSEVTIKASNGDLDELRQKQATRQSKKLVWDNATKDDENAHRMVNELVTDDLVEKARLMRQSRSIKR